jgi:hypothetical protein
MVTAAVNPPSLPGQTRRRQFSLESGLRYVAAFARH